MVIILLKVEYQTTRCHEKMTKSVISCPVFLKRGLKWKEQSDQEPAHFIYEWIKNDEYEN